MTNKNITDFFLKEYESIVKAHFNSSEKVTSFFRYVLIIYSAAIFLLINSSDKIDKYYSIKPWFFIIIAILGFFILNYLIQLRNESILYARTLNGIRRYFYDLYFDKEFFISRQYNVLPLQTQKPSFWDKEQFIWIFSTLVTINCSFAALGLLLIGEVYYKNFFWFIVQILKISENILQPILYISSILIICIFLYLHYNFYKRKI